MNPLFKEIEIKQRHIDATNGADCFGKMRKIHNGDGNFDLYIRSDKKFCESIAKPGSGCKNSVYGSLAYVKNQIRRGVLDPHRLTKYGRRLLKSI